jgi:GAF domain-containing protein
MEHRADTWQDEAVVGLLAEQAERARHALGVALASISVWERDAGLLRTIANAGALGPGTEARPAAEVYPVHSFPALATLLERRTPYCFGRGERVDVASASLVASLGMDTQAAAPIVLRGRVWGSLWVATAPDERPLSTRDLPGVVRAANQVARALSAG